MNQFNSVHSIRRKRSDVYNANGQRESNLVDLKLKLIYDYPNFGLVLKELEKGTPAAKARQPRDHRFRCQADLVHHI